MTQYRGFEVFRDADGWWATAGAGIITRGPFESEAQAKAAVDKEMDDDRQ